MRDAPPYRKRFSEVSKERDFYGFVLREGEARVEGNRLEITQRHNHPLKDEPGEYSTATYVILERFAESGKLKVTDDDGAPEIFDLSEARFLREPESLRLACPGFDRDEAAHRARGLRLFADHATLLYGASPAVADALFRAVGELSPGASAAVEGFHVRRRGDRYDLHQDGSAFVMNATLTPGGWVFGYPWISYSFPGLAQRIRASLAPGPWRC